MLDAELHENAVEQLPIERNSPVSSGTDLTATRRQSSPPAPPQIPDAALVRQALAGEHEAFELLVRRCQSALHSLISSYVREYHDADDMLQRVLLQLYLSLAALHAESSIFPWLSRVARNEGHLHLEAAVAALPARYRPVVSLRSLAGWSFREIARALGIPESTAKTRYYREANATHDTVGGGRSAPTSLR
jgi:DNA-directed RNA polymerase specialized sigma24 family protein